MAAHPEIRHNFTPNLKKLFTLSSENSLQLKWSISYTKDMIVDIPLA
jgi:hypothetical protein